MTKKLKKNQVVPIYHDPITKKEKEGDAKLLQRIRIDRHKDHVSEYWVVEFVNGDKRCRYV